MSEKTPQFGVDVPQIFYTGEADPSLISNFVMEAESFGYHSVWVSETVFGRLPCMDSIVLLSYVAACTRSIKIGLCTLLTVLRHPVHLAKSLASLDQMSKGRLIVGVALGGYTQFPFYSAFGFSPKEAAGRFEEGLRLMEKLWTEEEVSFQGRYWQVDQMAINPKPLQKPRPPLWFGAHAPRALKRAARMGDGWVGAGAQSTDGFAKEIQQIREYLREEGRDAESYSLSKRVYIAVDDNRERAAAKMTEYFQRRLGDPQAEFSHLQLADSTSRAAVFGSEEECVEELRKITSLGVDLLILDPVYDRLGQLERLAQNVLPKL